MFIKTNLIDRISTGDTSIEFLDSLNPKNVEEDVKNGKNSISTSPFSEDSGIYVSGHSKDNKILVKINPSFAKLVADKILLEKWTCFTVHDVEKRIGYTSTTYGKVNGNKIDCYSFTVAYSKETQNWRITLEEGEKEIVSKNGRNSFVANSYKRKNKLFVIISTNRINNLCIAIKSIITNLEQYYFADYFKSRKRVEETFKKN